MSDEGFDSASFDDLTEMKKLLMYGVAALDRAAAPRLRAPKRGSGPTAAAVDDRSGAAETVSEAADDAHAHDRFLEELRSGLELPPRVGQEPYLRAALRAVREANPTREDRSEDASDGGAENRSRGKLLRAPASAPRRQALLQQGIERALKSPKLTQTMGEWLGRLCLLEGVPFPYLVPDAAMLPAESIRFFYIDRNWVDSLVEGAFSIGKQSRRDLYQHEVMQTKIHDTQDHNEPVVRARLRGKPDPKVKPGGVITGLLLRSTVVADYPGLEVKAWEGEEAKPAPLLMLRMERLAPDILFCLFSGVPDRVHVSQPPEGLHFGALTRDRYRVALRWRTSADGHEAGTQIHAKDPSGQSAAIEVDVPLRPGEDHVVDVRALAATLGRTLAEQEAAAKGPRTTAAPAPKEFALQLVSAAEMWVFEVKTS